ncbi:MAG TPA: transposase family protein [Jatrophihabitantaceae bacterium]|nr:transposase family protein [Jatrophihabitantaceae bacterium]
MGCTERPRSHVFSVELFAGVPGGLAGYLAAYRVEFRGQPDRSCGPWWRSSCRLWPRPSTWSRAGCLVDGTITPCWSYAENDELWSRKHGTTGFNAQLVCLLDGAAIYISDPLPGCTRDAKGIRHHAGRRDCRALR